MKFLYKVLLSLNAIMLLIVVYFVKEKIWLPYIEKYSICVYILVLLGFTFVCLLVANFLRTDILEGGIVGVEMANDSYLPSYLGYFFVALSIPSNDSFTMCFVFAILFVFTFFSQTMYYNPLFLLFGYRFYYITKKNNMKIFIITRREILNTEDLDFKKLKRINAFTFIDKEKSE